MTNFFKKPKNPYLGAISSFFAQILVKINFPRSNKGIQQGNKSMRGIAVENKNKIQYNSAYHTSLPRNSVKL